MLKIFQVKNKWKIVLMKKGIEIQRVCQKKLKSNS